MGATLGRSLAQIGKLDFEEMLLWANEWEKIGTERRADGRTAWLIAWLQRSGKWIDPLKLLPPQMPPAELVTEDEAVETDGQAKADQERTLRIHSQATAAAMQRAKVKKG